MTGVSVLGSVISLLGTKSSTSVSVGSGGPHGVASHMKGLSRSLSTDQTQDNPMSRFTSLPLLSLLVTAAPALAQGIIPTCPDDGSCHISRFAPTGLSAFDEFGRAVDLDEETAVLGAPIGDAVYIYTRQDGQWLETQRLDSPGGSGTDFGVAVGLFGDRLVVGAPSTDTYRGAMYVYERTGGVWSLSETFGGPDDFGLFGTAVAIGPDWVVGGEPGVFGGRVRVYRDLGAIWGGYGTITLPGTGKLGAALALEGDNLLIGDWSDDDQGSNAGAAYHFVLATTGHTQVQKLTPAGLGGGDYFGYSLDFDGTVAVIGAYADDDLGVNSGAAYVYELDPAFLPFSPLIFEEKLLGCNGGAGDYFGLGVAVHGKTIVVGSPNQGDFLHPGGKAFVFRKVTFPTSDWVLKDALWAADGTTDDDFGGAVAVDGEQVLIGALENSIEGTYAGAGYLFSLQTGLQGLEQCPCDGIAIAESSGTGKPGTLGLPELEFAGPPVIGEQALVRLSNVLPGTAPVLIWGTTPGSFAFDGGELLVGDPHFANLPVVGVFEQVGVGWDIPLDISLCGADFYMQGMLLDPGAAGTFHTAQSNGVAASLGF